MKEREQLLEDLIERAYTYIGDVALTEQETDQLVEACIQQIEEMSHPSQTEQEKK